MSARELTLWRSFVVACTVGAAILILAGTAHAGGFSLEEQSPVAGGTGGAGTARPDDAGAAWYNPAALADGAGIRVGVGIMAALPALHASAADQSWETDAESGVSTPPHLFASYARGDFACGLSFGVPYGGGVTWPDDWAGRHEIVSSDLMVFRVAPFVAWRVGRARLSGGAHVNFGRLQLARSLDFVDTEGDVQIDLSGRSVGFDLAGFVTATPKLDLGLSYKSRSTIALAGGADFTAPDAFDAKTADQNASAELRLPDRIAAGARWHSGRVAVLADLVVSWWKVNEELVIDFENDATPDPVQHNNWQSTLGLRAGAEYRVQSATLLRGGAFVDPSPARDQDLAPSSPDSTRVGATVGLSRALTSDVTADLFYEYMHIMARESENPESVEASYGGRAQFLGVGLRLHR